MIKNIFYHNGIGPIVFDACESIDDLKGYYFWDSDWKNFYGPYETEMACEIVFKNFFIEDIKNEQ